MRDKERVELFCLVVLGFNTGYPTLKIIDNGKIQTFLSSKIDMIMYPPGGIIVKTNQPTTQSAHSSYKESGPNTSY